MDSKSEIVESELKLREAFDVGGPVGSISCSPDRQAIAVGGRDVFKLISLDLFASPDRPIFSISRNLRGKSANLNSSTNDVKWNPLPEFKNYICTAAMNGAVVVWNIDNGNARQDRIFSDHERTVNRVSWHPSAGNIFLSGSQDGTIKLFDLRSQIGCVATFLGKWSTVPVRDVQFSPFHSHLFAAAFDSGVVQLWDTRRASNVASVSGSSSSSSSSSPSSGSGGAERSWVAHQGLVLGVDWHPSERGVLATCSRDRTVKVWELGQAASADAADGTPTLSSATSSGSGSSQGPPPQRVAIQTIASVGRVQWRPGGVTRCAQLASAAALMDSKLHVWDVRKPYVPIASCLGHRDVVTGFVWLADGDAVMSGGKDGRLLLHRLASSYHPYRHLRTCALSFDVRGRLALAHDPIDRAAADILSSTPMPPSAAAKPPPPPPPISAAASPRTLSVAPNAAAAAMATLSLLSGVGSPPPPPLTAPVPPQPTPAASSSTSTSSSRPKPSATQPTTSSHPPLPNASTRLLAVLRTPAAQLSVARPIPTSSSAATTAAAAWQWPEEDLFVHFALNLRLRGKSLQAVCEHNAQVCERVNRIDLSQLWRLLNVLFADQVSSTLPALPAVQSTTTSLALPQPSNRPTPLDVIKSAPLSAPAGPTGGPASPSGSSSPPVRPCASSDDAFGSIDLFFDQDGDLGLGLGSTLVGQEQLQHESANGVGRTAGDPMTGLAGFADLALGDMRDSTSSPSDHSQLLADAMNLLRDALPTTFPAPSSASSWPSFAAWPAAAPTAPSPSSSAVAPPSATTSTNSSTATAAAPPAVQTDLPDADSDGSDPDESGSSPPSSSSTGPPKSGRRVAFAPTTASSSPSARRAAPALPTTTTPSTSSGGGGGSGSGSVSSSASYPNTGSDWLVGDVRIEMVASALEQAADRGDVQTCVLVLLALGDRLHAHVPARRARLWFYSYIELLQRHCLWTQATEVIRLARDDGVRAMNQKMTTVHLSCPHCHAQLTSPGHVCAKCRRGVAPCSLCQQPVRGALAWCQGCGHGGHLAHMQSWFAENALCPAGCLHVCSLQHLHV